MHKIPHFMTPAYCAGHWPLLAALIVGYLLLFAEPIGFGVRYHVRQWSLLISLIAGQIMLAPPQLRAAVALSIVSNLAIMGATLVVFLAIAYTCTHIARHRQTQ